MQVAAQGEENQAPEKAYEEFSKSSWNLKKIGKLMNDYWEQKKHLSQKVDEIKSADWDIEVPEFKVKGKEWLKSQVSRAFLPKYFPGYKKYLWIDADAWVNSWSAIELFLKQRPDVSVAHPASNVQHIFAEPPSHAST